MGVHADDGDGDRPARAESADVLVDAPADATVDALARELGPGRVPAVLYVNGRPLDPRMTLGRAPIREGTVVSLDDPAGCLPPEPVGIAELRITGGPRSGVVHRLAPAAVVVGSGLRAAIRVADPFLSPEAFTLFVGPDGRCGLEPCPDSHARLDGETIAGRTDWPFGAQLAAGGSLFEVAVPTRPDAALEVSQDRTGLDYNRPPRVRPPRTRMQFRIRQPPKQTDSAALPLVTALIPVLVAMGTAMVLRQWAYLSIGLLSPVGMLINHQMEKRRGRKSFRTQMAEYRARRDRIDVDAHTAFVAERGSAPP